MDQAEKLKNVELGRKLVSEQNFARAFVAGLLAMLVAAVIYGAFASGGGTFGFMAAAIGLAVGFTMQAAGHGIDAKFGVVASILAVVGCLLGNLFAVVFYVAEVSDVSATRVLFETPASELFAWLTDTLQFADLLFWLLAMGAAGYFVNRRLSREERLAVGMYRMMGPDYAQSTTGVDYGSISNDDR